MNNLKQIREIYGATQEEIASAISVNRVTVANWENGSSTASSGNQERLSIYYGIGPEYFYNKELDDSAKELLCSTAAKAKEIEKQGHGTRKKEEDFRRMFENLTFDQAMKQYMFSMKMMLATAENGDLDKLETAAQINEKMGERLKAIIEMRKKEAESGKLTLFDLMEKVESQE